MCFDIRDREEKVAKEDIICYKMTDQGASDNQFTPMFFNSSFYEKDKLNPVIKLEIKRTYNSFTGFAINDGYHSLIDSEGIEDFGYKWGIFVIPTGSLYYENSREYVSNQLIYKGLYIPVPQKPFKKKSWIQRFFSFVRNK